MMAPNSQVRPSAAVISHFRTCVIEGRPKATEVSADSVELTQKLFE